MYPGIVLDSELDPKRRPWYTGALQQPSRLVLSPAYLDASGSGFVVSLSKVVHEGRSVGLHTSTDPVVAVMGMDVTLGYLQRMLHDMFPLCGEGTVKCFLMDDQGWYLYVCLYFSLFIHLFSLKFKLKAKYANSEQRTKL